MTSHVTQLLVAAICIAASINAGSQILAFLQIWGIVLGSRDLPTGLLLTVLCNVICDVTRAFLRD
jgi:hypothetical protein